ncbi:hypothetical protein HMPREF9098_1568 [Kingella denitrificans ATCC 33394]|uniref:Uncharacterized protein n=1 Tax=Kingella denitrificans ATCC 33394 TaxID=888741 RepID=F0F0D3_9NEIS|nr:hypothetical protein HMPREF9098_1568 [Kingella denitrificans ATCC 33394]
MVSSIKSSLHFENGSAGCFFAFGRRLGWKMAAFDGFGTAHRCANRPCKTNQAYRG